MTQKRFIGANLKMNGLPKDLAVYKSTTSAEVVLFPSTLDLQASLNEGLTVGAQSGRAEEKGAFTGDVSMAMLKKMGVTHVLCGHSERRKFHGETDEQIAKQVEAAMKNGLMPVLCIGETEQERATGKTNDVLEKQLSWVISGKKMQASSVVVAYEPVWAIGTGKTPTVDEIQSTHAFIRSLLPDKEIRIIYGGSVTAENARGIFASADVDGALVGGASLESKGFAKIVESAA